MSEVIEKKRALSREEYIELGHLYDVVDEFSTVMKAKLRQKMLDGRRGWDDPASEDGIERAAMAHLRRGAGQEVDAANLVMMLWYLRNLNRSEPPQSQPLSSGYLDPWD